MHKRMRGERGFTLIEVMIATSLLALVLGAMMAVLADYSKLYYDAQEKGVLTTLRRRIIQNLNRREAWIVTYRTDPSFNCLLLKDGDCLTDNGAPPYYFTLYSGRAYPPPTSSIVFSYKSRASNYTTSDPNYGLTIRGDYCSTFVQNSSAASALRCPIRLELTWKLLSFGVPSPTDPGLYYPTGYFPYGYYEGSGLGSYFGPGYFPGTGSSDYWWLGTLGAQIEIDGKFQINESLKSRIRVDKYDFKLIKEVP